MKRSVLAVCFLFVSISACQPQKNDYKVVRELGQVMMNNYIYEDIGDRVNSTLLLNLEKGRYLNVTGSDLAELLQADIRSVVNDKHLRVRHSSEPVRKPASREIPNYIHSIGGARDEFSA